MEQLVQERIGSIANLQTPKKYNSSYDLQESSNLKNRKILFVSSGNSKNGISSLVEAQGDSLRKQGKDVVFFTVEGKGILGYLKTVPKLYKTIRSGSWDVVHAHYIWCGIIASLAFAQPLVVSLMGSDVKSSFWMRKLILFFNYFYWDAVIVKSKDLQKSISISTATIIPNGVDFEYFYPRERAESLKVTKWSSEKKHILFAANPSRFEKNYELAESAFGMMNTDAVELHSLINVPKEEMPFYYNAADVVVLTSLWEGSPNVIKEAMACNSKIVAVDVGDIREVISETDGCFVTSFDPKEIAFCLEKSLALDPKTCGRDAIQHLSKDTIAKILLKTYETLRNG